MSGCPAAALLRQETRTARQRSGSEGPRVESPGATASDQSEARLSALLRKKKKKLRQAAERQTERHRGDPFKIRARRCRV